MLGVPLPRVLGLCGIPGDLAVGLLDDTQELPNPSATASDA